MLRFLFSLAALLATLRPALVAGQLTWNSVTTAPHEYRLSPWWQVNARPQVRRYQLVAEPISAAPDGFSRIVYALNGQLPGPLIEANSYDTIAVTVINKLPIPLTVHWHGLWQNGTNDQDGVEGLTQCPIDVGDSFTYVFPLNGQYGTYWYHSHAEGTMMDGISGPLIIHSVDDPIVRGRDYDEDLVIHLTDWYHNVSSTILQALATPEGYKGKGAAPSADAALISGRGYFNCAFAKKGEQCTPTQPIEYYMNPGTRTRIRLISAGGITMFRFSADNHPLQIIEADGTGVNGPLVSRVNVFTGQRYSVLLTTTAQDAGTTFYIRAAMVTKCWAWVSDEVTQTALGIIRVLDSTGGIPQGTPTTQDWQGDVPNNGTCVDHDRFSMPPLVPENVPTQVAGRGFFRFILGVPSNSPVDYDTVVDKTGFFVNSIFWRNYPWKPILNELVNPTTTIEQFNIADAEFNNAAWYDIVLVNQDVNPAISHPVHLHAMDMHIVAEGEGDPTDAQLDALQYNTQNPLRRDTVTVVGGHFVVVRVHADIPGAWLLHCHIGWHLAGGFAAVVVVEPTLIDNFVLPRDNLDLCMKGPPQDINQIVPGKRKRRRAHGGQLEGLHGKAHLVMRNRKPIARRAIDPSPATKQVEAEVV